MSLRQRRWVLGTCLAMLAGATLFGIKHMPSSGSSESELHQLLGDAGAKLVGNDHRIAAWAPDPNYKPLNYYVLQQVDEATFRANAGVAKLAVAPVPADAEAVWRLPAGVALAGWSPADVPPGQGLQAAGNVGSAVVAMRWYAGQGFIVVRRSQP